MELLRPQLHHLSDKIRGVPHAIRESWPLNRVLITLAIALFFTFTQNTPYGL
jgi:hypothetical protein